ncbi:unnamed protein product [Arctogadus glacialis]
MLISEWSYVSVCKVHDYRLHAESAPEKFPSTLRRRAPGLRGSTAFQVKNYFKNTPFAVRVAADTLCRTGACSPREPGSLWQKQPLHSGTPSICPVADHWAGVSYGWRSTGRPHQYCPHVLKGPTSTATAPGEP